MLDDLPIFCSQDNNERRPGFDDTAGGEFDSPFKVALIHCKIAGVKGAAPMEHHFGDASIPLSIIPIG